MIETLQGNLLDVSRGILVHGCNCHGVMGSGIARGIREKWPSVYEAYHRYHELVGLRLGDVVTIGHDSRRNEASVSRHLHALSPELPADVIVVNAMTQHDFGRDASRVYVDYDALEAAFSRVAVLARDTGLPVHFPMIGCGLANGQWAEVSARIERALGPNVQKTLWVLPSV